MGLLVARYIAMLVSTSTRPGHPSLPKVEEARTSRSSEIPQNLLRITIIRKTPDQDGQVPQGLGIPEGITRSCPRSKLSLFDLSFGLAQLGSPPSTIGVPANTQSYQTTWRPHTSPRRAQARTEGRKGDDRLPGARRKGQEDAALSLQDRLDGTVDGDLLIVAGGFA